MCILHVNEEHRVDVVYLRHHSVRTSLERKHGGRNSYLVQNNRKSEMLLMVNRKATLFDNHKEINKVAIPRTNN